MLISQLLDWIRR